MISRETFTGILITIIFHLIMALVFLSIQMRDLKKTTEQRIVIDLVDESAAKSEAEKLQAENEKMMDKLYQQVVKNSHRSNTSVNVTEKFKENISTEEYVKKVQSELGMDKTATDASAGKSADNSKILTDQTNNSKENSSISDVQNQNQTKQKKVFFKGPTNIYLELLGRTDVNMIIPVYKCEGAGMVIVEITVNQDGDVTSANIDRTKSIKDECFLDAAYKAASKSKFNADAKATNRQKGKITYMFVAQ